MVSALGTASPAHAQLGVPMTTPAPLNLTAAIDDGGDRRVDLATDGEGHWVAVWESNYNLGGLIGGDYDLFTSRSADNGMTWSQPIALNTNANDDSIHFDRNARITVDKKGNWIACWECSAPIGGTGTDVDCMYALSADFGATWSAPKPLNINAAVDEYNDLDPVIKTDGNGVWVAVWRTLDTLSSSIGPDAELLTARSIDNGLTWSWPIPLNSNAAVDSAQDIRPQLLTNGTGVWLCAWQVNEMVSVDYDIVFSRSIDGGQSWSPITLLNSSAQNDGSANDGEVRLAVTSAGHFIAIWSSSATLGGTIGADADILISRSTDLGQTWSPVAPLNGNAATDSGDDLMPTIAADANGELVAAWHSNDTLSGTIGSDNDVLIARSSDGGLSWSPPKPANINAGRDSGLDEQPIIATGQHGAWIIAWNTRDSLGGTIGTEGDVLWARFALPDCNLNTIPDPMEPDSNGNGIPDSCEGITCPADIAPPPPTGGDGLVNVDDLLLIINSWGACGSGACSADIAPPGGDGLVNVDDLLMIINGWGACD